MWFQSSSKALPETSRIFYFSGFMPSKNVIFHVMSCIVWETRYRTTLILADRASMFIILSRTPWPGGNMSQNRNCWTNLILVTICEEICCCSLKLFRRMWLLQNSITFIYKFTRTTPLKSGDVNIIQ